MATKDELLEEAKELELTGVSGLNKAELEEAIAAAKADSDDSDSDVDAEDLSEPGQEALEELEPVAADEAALELDAHGPLILQSPDTRIMTGAVSEEHAAEQEKLLADKPEDYVGDITEAGVPEAAKESDEDEDRELTLHEKAALGIVQQEDIIDFPPPVGVREEQAKAAADADAEEDDADETTVDGGEVAADQKAVLYTDGQSGGADQNLGRAYDLPEKLKSSDPDEAAAAEESDSEARKEEDSE